MAQCGYATLLPLQSSEADLARCVGICAAAVYPSGPHLLHSPALPLTAPGTWRGPQACELYIACFAYCTCILNCMTVPSIFYHVLPPCLYSCQRWFLDGEVVCFRDGGHIALGLIAILIIPVLSLLPLAIFLFTVYAHSPKIQVSTTCTIIPWSRYMYYNISNMNC